jgi:hypothetical protein
LSAFVSFFPDPLNLLCEELKTWLVAMHSKGELQLLRHLEHRMQFLVALRMEQSCAKSVAAAGSVFQSDRAVQLVFEHTTAQLLTELEYRLHNWAADVYHKINRAGIGMCFDMLTKRMHITYEQMILYLFYLLNSEGHGLAPGDTLKNVIRLPNPQDFEANKQQIDLALIKTTRLFPECMVCTYINLFFKMSLLSLPCDGLFIH